MTAAPLQYIRRTILTDFLRALLMLSLITLLPGVARAVVPETVLHTFGYADGAHPEAGLTRDSAGNYYGTTTSGGSNNQGTVFKYASSTGELTTLHSFGHSADGAQPYGQVILGSDGMLYGTTYQGGPSGYGTVF